MGGRLAGLTRASQRSLDQVNFKRRVFLGFMKNLLVCLVGGGEKIIASGKRTFAQVKMSITGRSQKKTKEIINMKDFVKLVLFLLCRRTKHFEYFGRTNEKLLLARQDYQHYQNTQLQEG